MVRLAFGNDDIAAGCCRDLGGREFRRHAAAADAGYGVARHRLDLRRDGGDIGNVLGLCVARRIGGVKAIDIGQQDEAIGFHHAGDARGQPIIVAIANLCRCDRVILVDDGNAAEFDQSFERRARVEIAAALFGVAQGKQDLCGDDVRSRKNIGIGFSQTHLSRCSSSLALFEL